MSNSRKKTPVTGNTTAVSEKQDKRIANRRMRAMVRTQINSGVGDEQLPVSRHAASNVWSFDKDGKHRFDPKKHPHLMRK